MELFEALLLGPMLIVRAAMTIIQGGRCPPRLIPYNLYVSARKLVSRLWVSDVINVNSTLVQLTCSNVKMQDLHSELLETINLSGKVLQPFLNL